MEVNVNQNSLVTDLFLQNIFYVPKKKLSNFWLNYTFKVE